MTKFIVSLMAFCLFCCAAMASPSKQYAECAFPEADHAHGVIMFKQVGNRIVGRSDIHFHGGDESVEVELTKSPKRGNCNRLRKLVDLIDMQNFKTKTISCLKIYMFSSDLKYL